VLIQNSDKSHFIKSELFFDKVADVGQDSNFVPRGYKIYVQVLPLLCHQNTKA